ncbi:predicted protein [Sclerotinia sclerotiorum 1980 UF-70]|uniref:Uncharacterized protein n=2 Tax=Sclerotinia sclerotiorum (strain ATCC 18683 / 1980 / Ss-1) TaxID=665079 RepID=A7E668_SCLS1|nr:predicted protein [Sclerotinia sclerotiorum 1980 UF-70]APA07668.1 hypothetical protein sscle_03g024380 [Sclerotinia sclerotiorum 1980 UF-70]EDN91390.1 predicted protein [Sclerotinia sclerotiorum 1980 UF-70]
MVFNKNSKSFHKSKKPTKLPKSAVADAHPHIKMHIPANDFPVVISNADTNTDATSLEISTIPARVKRNRKGKSKIPKSARLKRCRDETLIRISPIGIVGGVEEGLEGRGALVMDATGLDSDSDSVIEESKGGEVDSGHFASDDLDLDLDLDLPLSFQHQIPTVVATMSNPLSGEGKCLPTTYLSTSEPAAIKGIITPSISPKLPPTQMASPITSDTVPNSYNSYTSFMYTPPHGTPKPLAPQSDQNPKESSPSDPLPKTSQSTPLLPAHSHSIRTSQKSSVSTLPPGFYEYHTISETVIIPRASEHGETGSGSGSGSNSANISSSESSGGLTPTSSQSSLREKCKISCGMKPSLLCAYILFGFCLVWLMWMSFTTISRKETSNRGGVGFNVIGGHVLPYGARVPAVAPFKYARAVKEVVPTAEVISSNFGLNTQGDRIDEITTSQVDKVLNGHFDEVGKQQDLKIIWVLLTWFAFACAYVIAIMAFTVLISEAVSYVPGWTKKISTEELSGEKV